MTRPDVHASGARAEGALWTLCGRLVIGPPDWLGSVSAADVRIHADGGGVSCPACVERIGTDPVARGRCSSCGEVAPLVRGRERGDVGGTVGAVNGRGVRGVRGGSMRIDRRRAVALAAVAVGAVSVVAAAFGVGRPATSAAALAAAPRQIVSCEAASALLEAEIDTTRRTVDHLGAAAVDGEHRQMASWARALGRQAEILVYLGQLRREACR